MRRILVFVLVLLFNSAVLAEEIESITPAQGWALATTAILTEYNGHRHDLLGLIEPTADNIQQTKTLLRDWWNINSRKELFDSLNWLGPQGGHRKGFELLGNYVFSLNEAAYDVLIKSVILDKEKTNQIETVKVYYSELGPKGIMGWDCIRYINLCRLGYRAEYLTKEEAWELIMPAAKGLQENFKSWKELGENYLIGREFWSYEQTNESGQRYEAIYQRLLTDPKSPWNTYSWDTSLNVD
jgi:hypothetical protein